MTDASSRLHKVEPAPDIRRGIVLYFPNGDTRQVPELLRAFADRLEFEINRAPQFRPKFVNLNHVSDPTYGPGLQLGVTMQDADLRSEDWTPEWGNL